MPSPKRLPLPSRSMTAAALSALCLALMGCADKQSVLFVTTTTIGIDADSKPPNVTIGYDRYEGFIGPTYATGAVPPVVSKIESNLKVFSPRTRQLYATGDAARLVTRQKVSEEPKKLYRDDGRPVMLFGTGSNIGLRVTFTGNMPDSFSFGYKRKEFSYIPLGGEVDESDSQKRTEDKYGSALAAIDMNLDTPTLPGTTLGITQFFATGDAAENLARDEGIRNRFLLEAKSAMRATSCKYGPDEATDKLDAAAVAQSNFREKLTAWLAREGIDTDPASFTICDTFAQARQKAVQDSVLMNP